MLETDKKVNLRNRNDIQIDTNFINRTIENDKVNPNIQTNSKNIM